MQRHEPSIPARPFSPILATMARRLVPYSLALLALCDQEAVAAGSRGYEPPAPNLAFAAEPPTLGARNTSFFAQLLRRQLSSCPLPVKCAGNTCCPSGSNCRPDLGEAQCCPAGAETCGGTVCTDLGADCCIDGSMCRTGTTCHPKGGCCLAGWTPCMDSYGECESDHWRGRCCAGWRRKPCNTC